MGMVILLAALATLLYSPFFQKLLLISTVVFVLFVLLCRLRAAKKPPPVGNTKQVGDSKTTRPLLITFLHPDLGIGGAERLIVDAAIGLQTRGHRVNIVTNYHDSKRAFKETCDGSIAIKVCGGWIPRTIKGRAQVLCASLRMIAAAVQTCVLGAPPQVWVVDQVAAVMPVLRLLSSAPVVFYCHFPDQLCDPSRQAGAELTGLKKPYRSMFDKIEALTMRFAHRVVCNSEFTKRVTLATFPKVSVHGVLYPPINITTLLAPPLPDVAGKDKDIQKFLSMVKPNSLIVTSINRYERKKNLMLAVDSFAELFFKYKEKQPQLLLVVAGGYDDRLPENVEYFKELQKRAFEEFHLPKESVLFLQSISDDAKKTLLQQSCCVCYTPKGEHFGIVPVEAMAWRKVVIAVNDAGPTESVTNSSNPRYGFLCEDNAKSFSEAFEKVLFTGDESESCPEKLRDKIGSAAEHRSKEVFSLGAFAAGLDDVLQGTL